MKSPKHHTDIFARKGRLVLAYDDLDNEKHSSRAGCLFM